MKSRRVSFAFCRTLEARIFGSFFKVSLLNPGVAAGIEPLLVRRA